MSDSESDHSEVSDSESFGFSHDEDDDHSEDSAEEKEKLDYQREDEREEEREAEREEKREEETTRRDERFFFTKEYEYPRILSTLPVTKCCYPRDLLRKRSYSGSHAPNSQLVSRRYRSIGWARSEYSRLLYAPSRIQDFHGVLH